MAWNENDSEELQRFKEELFSLKDNPESDDIRFKELIKQKLLSNKKIIHVLANKTLEEADAEPDEYFGINILPMYLIKPTQVDINNYICYEVSFEEEARYNEVIKYGQIIFYVLCEQKTLTQEDTGIARHDLLASLIMHDFNWSNIFGTQIHCVKDVPSTVDTNFAARTLVFQGKFPNNIVKTFRNSGSNGYESRVVNSLVSR